MPPFGVALPFEMSTARHVDQLRRAPMIRCFFFQAEGGIRGWSVTGVQTCALPIWTSAPRRSLRQYHFVVGNPCEMVLPQRTPWSGCPYCDRGAGLTEGPDPCFGGQSLVSTS